ncbi:hypothetical protein A2V56_01405 [Candidatus Woesebacteria bacterium RBG_19FT_COMBO_42_9]|uniref:Peptidase S24/S26A/S26B/S26C domain-containing protein n=1 Tax=Candidatus Woesebacteria bacterium RBG_16_42_24 TaxID=1802485 RepID=A0A1F7XLW4_9BACT|nr:MAG: hypothetical protein A2V97_04705 [Candidatus Woesebacteria bacterium RBG_16_42_24]OGM17924.1 MAG: hypothetical protein A2V56_01405 [Candidatus Woesebacteria bacterium RBG_19FT_COMBO_42_9]OGM66569.1 MAG: hypothetical protein A2985_04370 [Candidatus Woesebacteria bacterium RIFCSPLOWO2_01_FULL_43_11]
MGKIITIFLIIGGIAAFVYAFQAYSPVPLSQLISPKGTDPFSDSACTRIVTVKGSSMEPTFKDGQTTTFNKCIEGKKADLKVGTIVLIEKTFQPEEIVIIRKKVGRGAEVKYNVSTSSSPSPTKEVPVSEIKAIYEVK